MLREDGHAAGVTLVAWTSESVPKAATQLELRATGRQSRSWSNSRSMDFPVRAQDGHAAGATCYGKSVTQQELHS